MSKSEQPRKRNIVQLVRRGEMPDGIGVLPTLGVGSAGVLERLNDA
jgi:hypothetical protein